MELRLHLDYPFKQLLDDVGTVRFERGLDLLERGLCCLVDFYLRRRRVSRMLHAPSRAGQRDRSPISLRNESVVVRLPRVDGGTQRSQTVDTHLLLEFAKEGVLLGPQLFDLLASLAASVLQPLIAICSRGAVSVLGDTRSCGGVSATAAVMVAATRAHIHAPWRRSARPPSQRPAA